MTVLEGGLVAAVLLLTIVTTVLATALTATIRRVTLLERQMRRQRRHDSPPGVTVAGTAPGPPGPPGPLGDAVDLRGTDPDGTAIVVPLERTQRPTLLAFLSTSCGVCVGIWERLRAEGLGTASYASLVVVTKDADVEDLARIQKLASPEVPVILSSEAWDDFEVPGSPYVMLISAAPGSVVAEGAPTRWEDVVRMVATRGTGTASQ